VYDNAIPSTVKSAYESGDADSICDEVTNAKDETVSAIENSSEIINAEISSSTPLPSVLSVLDIPSFRIASPPFQDDEEDGINMPDLSGPSTPLMESKFHNHLPHPAPPSFPPPRLETFQNIAFEFPQSKSEPTREEVGLNDDDHHCMPQDITEKNVQKLEDEKYPVAMEYDKNEDHNDHQSKEGWRSIPICIEPSGSYEIPVLTDSTSNTNAIF
jgi:hypothetical protein